MTLKGLRNNLDMKQEDVAKALKVNVQTYKNWEQGKTEPKVSEAYKLAKLFKVNITDIDFKRSKK